MSVQSHNTGYAALDIANFLVFLMSDSYDDVTNMKLNKILYYAQGHYLQKFGKPLFHDRIEAWTHGPVIPSVYQAYKKNLDQPIEEYDISRIGKIDDETKAFLLDIARKYGRYTASTLRNMTHKPKSPWAMVGEGDEISTDNIKAYFSRYEPVITPFEISFSDDDFIGHRDPSGTLVLPEAWRDEEI